MEISIVQTAVTKTEIRVKYLYVYTFLINMPYSCDFIKILICIKYFKITLKKHFQTNVIKLNPVLLKI